MTDEQSTAAVEPKKTAKAAAKSGKGAKASAPAKQKKPAAAKAAKPAADVADTRKITVKKQVECRGKRGTLQALYKTGQTVSQFLALAEKKDLRNMALSHMRWSEGEGYISVK